MKMILSVLRGSAEYAEERFFHQEYSEPRRTPSHREIVKPAALAAPLPLAVFAAIGPLL
jgi:hypothetical protein